jgi:hypothetical protein
MSLTLTQSATAVGSNSPASFLGVGGTEPYLYQVLPGGAGGSIDASTGLYTAPANLLSSPNNAYDTIQVTDYVGDIATAQILVGNVIVLFCDILQKELGLSNGRVYEWDQKIMQPTDSGLYIAVSVPICKPFASDNSIINGIQVQTVNMQATFDIDIISRGPEARDRKEEVILALNSIYSQQQQQFNSFSIGKLPLGSQFVNLSNIDGAAIPYRYRISINVQYFIEKHQSAPYFDTFLPVEIVTDN